MEPQGKYARPEWERRFLLSRFPTGAKIHRTRKIVDRYIAGTSLRLRRYVDDEGGIVYKLTQKIPAGRNRAFRGMITTMHLTGHEFDVFSALTASVLTKTRYSVPPLGIDVFEGELSGLVMAEAEFDSSVEAAAFTPPWIVAQEISSDSRFEGGNLAIASRQEVADWLAERGLALHTK